MSPLLVHAVPAGTAQVAVPVQNPAPPAGEGEEFGKASPIALVVILVLALATILLIRGMSKRIRRLPASFEQAEPEQEPGTQKADGKTADGGTA
ncbi:hypothetical protein [Pseudonocardia zijingensis]|jgi:hypothetical protein|uniref:Secreted protein n=1 Tax=Pseudonocardia zijingensis TaxID=153376 RepID=A0ABN1Q892_9PSEU